MYYYKLLVYFQEKLRFQTPKNLRNSSEIVEAKIKH